MYSDKSYRLTINTRGDIFPGTIKLISSFTKIAARVVNFNKRIKDMRPPTPKASEGLSGQ